MAINVEIPKDPCPDCTNLVLTRGAIIHTLLAGGHGINVPQPAQHENALVDNALGMTVHVYSPNDILTG